MVCERISLIDAVGKNINAIYQPYKFIEIQQQVNNLQIQIYYLIYIFTWEQCYLSIFFYLLYKHYKFKYFIEKKKYKILILILSSNQHSVLFTQ